MNIKILADIDFQSIIGESMAQTQTGAEIINKYKSYLMVNEASCALINSFVKEASQHTYDNGVAEALATVADYINANDFVVFLENTRKFDRDIDVMLECKEKDLALFKLAKEIKELKPEYQWIDNTSFIVN